MEAFVGPLALPGVAHVGLFATSGTIGATISARVANLSMQQIGPARATSVVLARETLGGGEFTFEPLQAGAEEPWLTVRTVAGVSEIEFSNT